MEALHEYTDKTLGLKPLMVGGWVYGAGVGFMVAGWRGQVGGAKGPGARDRQLQYECWYKV